MNVPLFFSLVLFLGAVYIWIGNKASKDLQTSDSYFLMGRNLTFLPLTLTLVATQLGGGTLLGAAAEAYNKGWAVVFYPLGATIGLFCLGLGFGGKLRQLNISTIAEIFEKVYKSKSQRYIASGLSIAALFFILVAQGIAAKAFFIAIGVQSPLIFVIFWSVLVAYTVMGGLKAVVDTDVLQALFIIATLLLAFLFVDTTNISPKAVIETTQSTFQIPWVTWLFMPLLFMLIEQDMGQRCFAAISTRVVSRSAIVAGITLFVCSSIAIYFGVLAKDLGLELSGGPNVLIEAITALTNPLVSTLFMVAIFMAVISTADSLLCSISSNLSYDFLKLGNITDKKRVKLSQLLTLITGLSALGLTFLFTNVITLLMISYELSVCVLFVPIAAAVISSTPSKRGAFYSMILGGLGFILFRVVELPLPKEVLTITLALCGYVVGSKLQKEAPRESKA